MGQCSNCGKCIKANQDIRVDELVDEQIKNKNILDKYSSSPYYCKVIYLQTRIKRFLTNKRFLTKNKEKTNKAINESPGNNSKNINVNINVNVNMTK
ncbi:MAG: hypothetical protein MJ252_11110, partial [archaeon]|nr:hypothetical protein [archaeon]